MTAASVIIRNSGTSRAAHTSVPVRAVRLRHGHLAERMATNRRVTLPSQYDRLAESGTIANFAIAAGEAEGNHYGFVFTDSDVYKWLEAASWSLASVPDARLKSQLDHVIELVVAAQRPDGYLNTWYQLHQADRFRDLTNDHELYCAGHLIQAGIANHRCTGDTALLDVAVRFADLLVATFGPGKIEQTDGHPEIELALIELARETGREAYLDLAQFFVDIRGHGTAGGREIFQDATPLRQQHAMVGHAVRAVYLNAGATDLVLERVDAELRRALVTMKNNMLERKSYVTGGIGSRYEGESFGLDYELPNNRAYAESCAAIGAVMWLWRMLLLENKDDSSLADAIERIIYNAILPGVSLSGDEYFYQNPLRDEDGSMRRKPWFDCACCPPNIARFLAQLPGYVATVTSQRYGESDAQHDQVWIHQYVDAELRIPTLGGGVVAASIATSYPWDGEIALEITGLENASYFTLQMRVPDWARNASATINGDRLPDAESAPGQYLTLTRHWQVGDVVTLSLPMPVRRIVAHPRVANNAGRLALMRGPLVYCIEETDNDLGDVRDVVLQNDVLVTAANRPELLGGVTTLSMYALLESPAPAWDRALYRNVDLRAGDAAGMSEVQISAVPYMVWANRGAGPMTVWLRHR